MMPQYRNEKFVLKKYCAPPDQQQSAAGDGESQHDGLEHAESRCLQIDFIDVHTILLSEAAVPDVGDNGGEHGGNRQHGACK